MMHKPKENGMLFSAEADAQYLSPPVEAEIGEAHDEWKIFHGASQKIDRCRRLRRCRIASK
jgi:hypothetical protein